MEIREIGSEAFGRCIRITNGIITCEVAVEFGPRMIWLGFSDGQNILFTDPEKKYAVQSDFTKAAFGSQAKRYLYGGHRVHLSPETLPQASYPDNAPVVYTILSEGVSFAAPLPKQEGIQLSFEVIMSDSASNLMVVHSAKNCSKEAQTFGLAATTLLKGCGTAVLPLNRDQESYLPNRFFAFWPETDVHDKRICYGNRFLTVRHDPGNRLPLRLGTNDAPGWSAYANERVILAKRFLYNPQAAYPDSGSSCEVRMTADFAELQSMSPLYRVEPGERIKHVENISLFLPDRTPDFSKEDQTEQFFAGLLE